MQVATGIIVRAVFLLQTLHKLAEALALIGHDIGKEQRIEQAIALGEMALNANTAGLFPSDKNLPLQHEVANIFKPDPALVELAAIPGTDTIQHARGIEGANHLSRPVFT